MDLKEIVPAVMAVFIWLRIVSQLQALVNRVMNIRVPWRTLPFCLAERSLSSQNASSILS
jgi:hypothetical protein